MPARGLEAGARAGSPAAGQDVARAHPALARIPPRRNGLERLHAPARPRVESRRARRDGAQPGAPPRGVRPRRRGRGPPGRRTASSRSSSSTATRATRCVASRTAPARSSTPGSMRTQPPCATLLPADLVFTNHVLLGGPVGAATGARYAVKAHGSELEYSMRGNPELGRWGRESLELAAATFVGSEHIRTVLEEVCGTVERVHEVPPGVDVELWTPEERGAALDALVHEARLDAPNPGNGDERQPDDGNAARLDDVPRGRCAADRRLLRQAHRAEGRRRPARRVRRARRAARRGRVRPRARPARGTRAPQGSGALFTGPLEHRHLRHLLALADACVVPSIFPEAFGMVAAEAAAAGCPPVVARHSGLAEVAAGLEEALPAELGRPRLLPDRRTRPRSTNGSRRCSGSAPTTGRAPGDRPPGRGGAVELGRRRRAPARRVHVTVCCKRARRPYRKGSGTV